MECLFISVLRSIEVAFSFICEPQDSLGLSAFKQSEGVRSSNRRKGLDHLVEFPLPLKRESLEELLLRADLAPKE